MALIHTCHPIFSSFMTCVNSVSRLAQIPLFISQAGRPDESNLINIWGGYVNVILCPTFDCRFHSSSLFKYGWTWWIQNIYIIPPQGVSWFSLSFAHLFILGKIVKKMGIEKWIFFNGQMILPFDCYSLYKFKHWLDTMKSNIYH